jgi:hypothetical protein
VNAQVDTPPPKPAPASPGNRRLGITIAAIVGGVIVVNLLAQGLDRAVGGDRPGGASGSSYATAPRGEAAYASLISHYGHRVEQRRGPIDAGTLPENATVFVLEPTALTTDDASALLQFVDAGGRLVVGGRNPFYLHNLRDRPPTWQPPGDSSWTATDPSIGAIRDIEGEGIGSWSSVGSGTTLAGVDHFALLTRDRVGSGEILFLADTSPLQNAYLATADNAAFGLALAGDADRPVIFAEGPHGFGTSRGIAAIPDRWKVALGLLAFAALVFVWSRARRFGPADQAARDLPPARAEYVQALSISLERTHDRAGSLAPAQRWARARLTTRAGLGPGANDDELVRAAHSFGCTSEEITALLAPVPDDRGVVALGQAIARIGAGDRRVQ